MPLTTILNPRTLDVWSLLPLDKLTRLRSLNQWPEALMKGSISRDLTQRSVSVHHTAEDADSNTCAYKTRALIRVKFAVTKEPIFLDFTQTLEFTEGLQDMWPLWCMCVQNIQCSPLLTLGGGLSQTARDQTAMGSTCAHGWLFWV